MFCGKCGVHLQDDAMFCGECGAPTRNLREQNQPEGGQFAGQERAIQHSLYNEMPDSRIRYSQQPVDGNEEIRKNFTGGYKKWIVTGVAILVIGIGAILLYNFLPRPTSPENTIAGFESAIENLDLDAMVECFDSSVREEYETLMEEQLGGEITGSTLGLIATLGVKPKVDMRVTNTEYTDREHCRVTVDYTISFVGQSLADTAEVDMILENGKWVISSDISSLMGGLM